MRPILFNVTYRYNGRHLQNYNVYGTSEEDAIFISGKMFVNDCGVIPSYKVKCAAVAPSDEDACRIREKVRSELLPLMQKFERLSYSDFIQRVAQYMGYSTKLTDTQGTFLFDFMGFTCKAVYDNGASYISDESVLIRLDNGRVYVIRNRLKDIYISV